MLLLIAISLRVAGFNDFAAANTDDAPRIPIPGARLQEPHRCR